MGLEQIEVSLLDYWPRTGGDRDVALAAWASSHEQEAAEARSDEDVERVVRSIVNHNHDTPKEGVWLKFFIRCPIYVERQLDKYRMTQQSQGITVEWQEGAFGRHNITQNELSGRYRTLPDRPYNLPEDVREILWGARMDVDGTHVAALWSAAGSYYTLLDEQHRVYQRILNAMPQDWRKSTHPRNADYKRVREVMRGMLGTAYLTDMRLVLNLNALEHIGNQRLAKDTQLETRVVAAQLITSAVTAGVAPEALDTMIQRNGWAPLMDEIERAVAAERGEAA